MKISNRGRGNANLPNFSVEIIFLQHPNANANKAAAQSGQISRFSLCLSFTAHSCLSWCNLNFHPLLSLLKLLFNHRTIEFFSFDWIVPQPKTEEFEEIKFRKNTNFIISLWAFGVSTSVFASINMLQKFSCSKRSTKPSI